MNRTWFGVVLLSISLCASGLAQSLSVTNGLTLWFKGDGSLFADQSGTIPVTEFRAAVIVGSIS